MNADTPNGNVIPFPQHLRVVASDASTIAPDPAARAEMQFLVDHDGRSYELGQLLQLLAPHQLREVGNSLPRSGQELWDDVIRRWPALADEITAASTPAL